MVQRFKVQRFGASPTASTPHTEFSGSSCEVRRFAFDPNVRIRTFTRFPVMSSLRLSGWTSWLVMPRLKPIVSKHVGMLL